MIATLVPLELGLGAGQGVELRSEGIVDLVEEREMTAPRTGDRVELSLEIDDATDQPAEAERRDGEDRVHSQRE